MSTPCAGSIGTNEICDELMSLNIYAAQLRDIWKRIKIGNESIC